MKRTYLGDGVYAEFDGYQVWLRTERADGLHEIALEPAVFAALGAYFRSCIEGGARGGGVEE